MIADSEICINPVNWSIDETAAQLNDSVTVSVAAVCNVLIVNGLDSKSLFVSELELLFKEGNYHLQELKLY